MPKVFRATTAGFFFMDQIDPKMMYTFTSVGSVEDSGVKYIKSVAKFPTGFGYTGKCIELKKTLTYYSETENANTG